MKSVSVVSIKRNSQFSGNTENSTKPYQIRKKLYLNRLNFAIK